MKLQINHDRGMMAFLRFSIKFRCNTIRRFTYYYVKLATYKAMEHLAPFGGLNGIPYFIKQHIVKALYTC